MSASADYSQRWRQVVPADALALDVPFAWGARRRLARRLLALSPGETVALRDALPLSRSRCRRLAAAGSLDVEREYVALPSLRAAAFLVEDDPVATRWLWASVLATPPGIARLAAPVGALVAAGRSVLPWWLLGCVAPGRVVIGRRHR